MTATARPTTSLPSLPALDAQTTDIAQSREKSMTQMQSSLNAAWALLDQLPEEARIAAQTALMEAWDTAAMMGNQWSETQELLLRSAVLVQLQQGALEEMGRQRDEAFRELRARVLHEMQQPPDGDTSS
jgi:hypothetical protein